jgi:hypothetical protein
MYIIRLNNKIEMPRLSQYGQQQKKWFMTFVKLIYKDFQKSFKFGW